MDFKVFWLCFVPLFDAVDAIGTLPIFMSLTEGLDAKSRVKVIVSSVITALFVGILFLFVGDAILKMLGINVEDFILDLALKAVHYRYDDDEHENADENDKDGQDRIKGDEPLALFRLQVSETYTKFK